MKYILACRRTFVAIFSISCLTVLGVLTGTEVGGSIAMIAAAISAANAAEKGVIGKNPTVPKGE